MDFVLKSCNLREFQTSDAGAIARLANNPAIAGNLRDAFPSPYTFDKAVSWLEMVEFNKQNFLRAIIVDGELAGSVGLHACHDVYRFNLELGYWLGEPFWNRGIMTEVVKAIVAFGFNELKAHRIFAGIFSFNTASARVLQKCGFKHEATLHQSVFKNGQWADELVFALINPQHVDQ